MRRAKFILGIALALVFSQLQCIAGCALSFNEALRLRAAGETTPPCHRHQSPDGQNTRTVCGHSIAAANAILPDSAALSLPTVVFFGRIVPVDYVPEFRLRADPYHTASPPGAPSLRQIVER